MKKKKVKTERKREKRKEGGLTGEGKVSETGSRESSNDDSDQRTTCQTLEVISCFIEDFYGILAACLTSQRVGRDGEKDSTHTHTLPFSFLSSPATPSCLV